MKLVDKDHSFTYSPVVLIFEKQEQLNIQKILNNPFSDHIGIMLSSDKKQTVRLLISDICGRTHITKNEMCNRGTNYLFVDDLEKLLPGMYIVQIISEKEIIKEKIIKVKL